MLENYSIINWILKHGIKTEDGTPYDFKNHLFMYDVLRELAKGSKNVVVYKAAQIGFSTAAILATLWIAKNRGIDIIYTLPTAADVKDFAGGKINRIVAQNSILKEWVKDHDTVEQKTVGNNIVYYRGTFTQKAAMMVSSSLNAYDEVDTSDQRVIEQYATRLQASEQKAEWYFSHPSVPGNGVSKHWEKSDQRHWFVKCPECKQEQFLSWPESIDMERKVFQCKGCHAELSDDVRRKGRWVAKYKHRDFVGFWIPLLICPWVSAKEIIKLYNEKSAEYFTNKVLGLPYVGSGNKPTIEMIEKNLTSEVNLQEGRIVIGCDTGLGLHYICGNEKGRFYYGEAKPIGPNSPEDYDPYDEIEKLLIRWPKSIVVFDAGGDLIGPRKLRAKYPGRVFLCHYSVDRKTMQLIRWGKDKEEGNVNADRNRMIQLVIDEYDDGRTPINGTIDDWYEFWLHYNNIYRTEEENSLGIMERKWHRSGPDHYVHADVYWRVGMNRFGMGEGAVIGKPLKVFAKKGYEVSPDNTMPIPSNVRGMKAFK